MPKNEFQSTRPIRGATRPTSAPARQRSNFNPRAPYGARRIVVLDPSILKDISIHAPHTGRDLSRSWTGPAPNPISIHAPHTGRDACTMVRTRSMTADFNPRAPYGARRDYFRNQKKLVEISIHAPHTGRDGVALERDLELVLFQSTRPIRGATAKMHNLCSAFLQQQTVKA